MSSRYDMALVLMNSQKLWYRRPAQDQANLNSNTDGEGTHKAILLAEDLLSLDRERRIIFP